MSEIIEQITKFLMEQKKCNLRLQKQYEKEINELPRGHLYIRKQLSQEYLHLSSWCNEEKRKVHKYIGNINKDKTILPTIQAQMEKRKQIEEMLKNTAKDLEAIEKMLKIADKRTQEHNINSVRQTVKEISENKKNPLMVDMTDTQKITDPKSIIKLEDNINK